MTPPKLEPWSSLSEWQRVYQLLYSTDISQQREGLQFVRMWAARVPRIPVSVESTADLLQSLHTTGNGSIPAMSLAVIRFVNGHVDKAQAGVYARSVGSVAADLGIPDWVIDTRHNATHRTLPDPFTLRMAVVYVLKWLENTYWIPQNTQIEFGKSEVELLILEYIHANREMERSYVKGRKSNKSKITLVMDKISSLPPFETSILPSALQAHVFDKNTFAFDFWMPLVSQLHKMKPSVIAHFIYKSCQDISGQYQTGYLSSMFELLISGGIFGPTCQELHPLYINSILVRGGRDPAARNLCHRILQACDRVEGKQALLAQLFAMLDTTRHVTECPEESVDKQLSDMRIVVRQLEERAGEEGTGGNGYSECGRGKRGARFTRCDTPLWEYVPLGCTPSHITPSLEWGEEEKGAEIIPEKETIVESDFTEVEFLPQERNMPRRVDLAELGNSIRIWGD